MVGKWQVLAQVPVAQKPITAAPVAVNPIVALEEAKARAKQATLNKAKPPIEHEELPLESLPGVGKATAKRLKEAGFNTQASIQAAGITGLVKIKGMTKARAERLLTAI